MGQNECCGFFYDTEEELKEFLGIDKYLNLKFGKHVCQSFDVTEEDDNTSLSKEWKLPDTLGMEICDVRQYQDLTQEELARKIGIGVTTLSKVENGNLNISKKVRSKLEEYIKTVW